ncbi:MAG: 50S ribosomal protein L28 [Bacteriovoracaceae bacterium]
MGRTCDLTGKRRQIGMTKSHANNRLKTKNEVNLQTKVVFDPDTGKKIKLRVSTRAIKSLDKAGGLTKYLRKNAHKIFA